MKTTPKNFCGRGWKFVHPKQSFLLSDFFSGQINKLGSAKSSAVDLLGLNTLKGTQTALLTPRRYDEHTHAFYMGVPWSQNMSASTQNQICVSEESE